MKGFTKDDVLVKCNFPIGRVTYFEMSASINSHTVVILTVEMEHQNMNLVYHKFSEEPIAIELKNDVDTQMLFYGTITDLKISIQQDYVFAIIKANSLSYFLIFLNLCNRTT